VCGILCESHLQTKTSFAVIGIGLNISLPLDEFPADLIMRSTSLQAMLRRPIDKHQLLQAILRQMNRLYDLLSKDRQRIIKLWSHYCGHLNHEVVILQNDFRLTGCFKGINDNGAALIELPTSEMITVENGDFTLRE